MLGACAARVAPLCGASRTWVVTTREQLAAMRAALPEIPQKNFLCEPFGRNTAAAVGLGARCIVKRDADAIVAVLPADHWIEDAEGFRRVVARALELAASGKLVTSGIRPTHAETGYGYIELDREIESGVWRAARFLEKPAAATAETFVRSGRHLWNSGMFFFRADRILEEIGKWLPDLATVLHEIGPEPSPECWERVPAVSIDVGVMEKVDEFYVVSGDFGWSDIGSFASLPQLRENVIEVDSQDNVVHAEGQMVALLGVRGLCVVVTKDAVLVCPADRAQEVRSVVSELERRGRKDIL